MKVLVTGASGMLGAALAARWQGRMAVYATGSRDFPGNLAERFRAFDLRVSSYDELGRWADPDVVVHCAALTNVDYCERHPEEAMAVNGESVGKLLGACPRARVIYISTNAVFSSGQHLAREQDPIDPENAYAKSKALGESRLAEAGGPHCAVRTTIVGRNANPAKRSFAEWIIASAAEGAAITLFDDVLFTPISIWEFAEELEWIMDNGISGILHVTGREPLTKHRFGMSLCARLGLDASSIRRGSIDDAGLVARRPKDYTLDSSRYEALSRRRLPDAAATLDRLTQHFEEYHHERIQDRK